MARMHSRRKGASGSTRPIRSSASSWLRHKPDVVEKLVIRYGKEDISPAVIGTILRDQYGIPTVMDITKKRVTEILDENKINKGYPQDLLDLMKRAVTLRKHLDENKNDLHSKRGLILIESKIRRLTKYYKRTGKVSIEWSYKPEEAKLIIG